MLQKRLAYLQSAAITALPIDDDTALKQWQAHLPQSVNGLRPAKDEDAFKRISSIGWWDTSEPVFSQLRQSIERLWSAPPPWCSSEHSSRLLHLAQTTSIGDVERQKLLDQVSCWEAMDRFSAIVQAVALVCHEND